MAWRSHLAHAGLLLAGLAGALVLRLAVAGGEGPRSLRAGLAFAAALIGLALAAGWRPGSPRPGLLVAGILGAAGLVLVPAWSLLTGTAPHFPLPAGSLLPWALAVTFVAIGEEVLLRGALFTAVEGAAGAVAAVAVAALALALLHIPLYGWQVVPLDLAAGVWLGGLRVLTGGVSASATAHTLADLATWWLV